MGWRNERLGYGGIVIRQCNAEPRQVGKEVRCDIDKVITVLFFVSFLFFAALTLLMINPLFRLLFRVPELFLPLYVWSARFSKGTLLPTLHDAVDTRGFRVRLYDYPHIPLRPEWVHGMCESSQKGTSKLLFGSSRIPKYYHATLRRSAFNLPEFAR